ncbi:MAG TPA: hypothetical protein VGQ24_05075, partial [Gemmatimonadales bacterium]|nr:hypothetical protein [Gemmatimonadales bacterium]
MSRLRRAAGPLFGLCHLHAVRVGAVRVKAGRVGGGAAGQTTARPHGRETDGQREQLADGTPQLDLLPCRPA